MIKQTFLHSIIRQKNISILLGLAVCIFLFSTCKKDGVNTPHDVLYRVTFKATWSSTTHPNAYPTGAHFSPIIGMSHNESVRLFGTDSLATAGIKRMAEQGKTSPLDEEINDWILEGRALDILIGEGIDSPGQTDTLFGLDVQHPLASVVTMIAPSPDWFLFATTNLYENGEWVEFKAVQAAAYDAGTDSGTDFTSDNQASYPPENIHLIGTPPLAQNGYVKSMGEFQFQRIQ